MIVGKGLIASGFQSSNTDYSDCIIFASGVSNSIETDNQKYNREKQMILKTMVENKGVKIIYFSSILADISKNDYFKHKLDIENTIKTNSDNYIIFRIPQIVGRNGNPKNLINYLKNCIINNFEILTNKDIERSLLDVEDLVKIVDYCKEKVSCEILTVSGIEKIKVVNICKLIGGILNKKPILKIVDDLQYENWSVENSKIIDESIINIDKSTYNFNLLKKYIV